MLKAIVNLFLAPRRIRALEARNAQLRREVEQVRADRNYFDTLAEGYRVELTQMGQIATDFAAAWYICARVIHDLQEAAYYWRCADLNHQNEGNFPPQDISKPPEYTNLPKPATFAEFQQNVFWLTGVNRG